MNDILMINKSLVRRHFDRHACEYDRHAIIQREMALQLIAAVVQRFPKKQFVNILEIGCGTGLLTALLRVQWDKAKLTAMDISAEMIDQAKIKLGYDAVNMEFILADAEEWAGETMNKTMQNPEESFDLIISNATFQWFQSAEQTIENLLHMLHPNGVLAFTTFGPRTFFELHDSFRAAEVKLHKATAIHGLRFNPPSFWQALFAEGEFNWLQQEKVMHYNSVREFLSQVKRVGAGNASVTGEKAGYSGKRIFAEMQHYYDAHYRDAQGVRATYQLGMGLFENKKMVAALL